jgi:2-polyprenyl-3-methyl-5-hydroxy-6-metoxy-1,4-benzoquinol methylase
MDRSVYLEPLARFEAELMAMPDTALARRSKVIALLTLSMRYETVHFDPNLKDHPFRVLAALIEDARLVLRALKDILFIEAPAGNSGHLDTLKQEDKHEDLFNVIWKQYDRDEFDKYVQTYVHRIKINDITPLIHGKRVIDFGCGNGVFCFAMLAMGAAEVVGIDFGAESIEFARRAAQDRGVAGRSSFKVASVYDTGCPDGTFDFAIQNGVFHHLDEPMRANREVERVLRRGGHFWTYVNGEGSLEAEILNLAVRTLSNVSADELSRTLSELNVSTGKKAHLTDGFKATYAFTTYAKLTDLLQGLGFGEFRRLTGGTRFDYDLDKVLSDPYGLEKYGEGILRVLARKL